MNITREEILSNRKKWIGRLKDPESKKAKGGLANKNGGFCCLGHGCEALEISKTYDVVYLEALYGASGESGVAPYELIEAVGLYSHDGSIGDEGATLEGGTSCLAALNDETDFTPQQIGEYLETVIEGGENTPFRPLTDYEVAK